MFRRNRIFLITVNITSVYNGMSYIEEIAIKTNERMWRRADLYRLIQNTYPFLGQILVKVVNEKKFSEKQWRKFTQDTAVSSSTIDEDTSFRENAIRYLKQELPSTVDDEVSRLDKAYHKFMSKFYMDKSGQEQQIALCNVLSSVVCLASSMNISIERALESSIYQRELEKRKIQQPV